MSTVMEKSLDYVVQTGETIAASEKLAEAVVAEYTKAAAMIPAQIEKLLSVKLASGAPLVSEEHRELAGEKLASHSSTLELLDNLLDVMQREKKAYNDKLAMLGQGSPTKQASASGFEKRAGDADDQLGGGYLGRRLGDGEHSAADIAYLSGLGLLPK